MQTGGVHHMECSCPYAQEHTHCKHMAAVLFELDAVGEEKIPYLDASEETGAQPNSTDAELTGTPLTVQKEWRDFFTPTVLKKGEEIVQRKQLHNFSCDDISARAVILTSAKQYAVHIMHAPDRYNAQWNPKFFLCDCGSKQSKVVYLQNKTIRYPSCPHQAALLLYWEQQRGPWQFTEPPEVMQKRLQKERKAQEAKKCKERIEREKVHRRELLKEAENKLIPALQFFPDSTSNGIYFDVKKAVARMQTNPYYIERAAALLTDGDIQMEAPSLDYGTDGQRILSAQARIGDEIDCHTASVQLDRECIVHHHCSCNTRYYFYVSSPTLCDHELVLLTQLQAYIARENPGDATDRAADNFFRELDAAVSAAEDKAVSETPAEKTPCVVLTPRITVSGGEIKYSFRVGLAGGKQFILKGFRDFLQAVEEDQSVALSKALTLDFSTIDFTQDSLPWLSFIQRKVGETDEVNGRLSGRSYYTPSLSVRTQDTLIGATLDRFYDLAEGTSCEYQNKDAGIDGTVRVGHMPLRIALSSARIADNGGNLLGVAVTGRMPIILRGSVGSYILSEDGLSRITKEETQVLRPFRSAADKEGNIRFQVGRERMAEFYYRVIPRLIENDCVEFEDACAEEVQPLLPPEPVFTFRLDIDADEKRVTCEAIVSYADNVRRLPCRNEPNVYRDAAQEERVLLTIQKYFSAFQSERQQFVAAYTPDSLYSILTAGVQALSRFGEVQGSDAFRRSAVRPMPQLRVGVSIESGLLELSILSKDMSPQELLDVLESYRQKKKYHRLRSGEFITLTEDIQLASVDAMMADLDLRAQDVIGGKVTIPAYRALYLDSLLEKHDALASSRDRTYRSLIKNFKTIRDADYEVPPAQADVLRPYQAYGYKWMRTLAAAGFGGVLADEMGLGKTIQTIAFIQSLRDTGNTEPCLIVSPAGLIYNWQEEFARFAPALDVQVIAGTAGMRQKKLHAAADAGAVCVTSYDMLRQDLAAYAQIDFSVMVIDEAQYIKNQKAAMTKAVKAVHAKQRFALTGTPIENRLAELWSIFDFMMPGFLYGYTEFSKRFETPITKQKDSVATARLRQMVAPFILRRLKADVLKDLPPKLEEVRYTRFEPQQRKVYDGQVVRMKQLLSNASSEDKIQIFAELMRIRQICCDPSLLLEDYDGGSAKRTACIELIQNAIGGGHRMLVFSQFTSMLALLEDDLQKEGIPFYKITGATPKEQRAKLVRQFNDGDTPVFLISLKAGGTGLNLTGADMVIHYDPWWNLAAQNQATDRAHRIGQQNQVTVYRLIVKDTIEERILALQESKRDLADAVLSGEHTAITSLSNEELLDLLG